jgi:hypothetical protein
VRPSLAENPGRTKLRTKLIRTGRLVAEGSAFRFVEDVAFSSPSAAASIIWGSNLNGRKVFGLDGPPPEDHVLHFPINSSHAIEGYKRDQVLYIAERDQSLAKQRKELDSYTCQACGFKLSVDGHFVVECHHLDPISLGQRKTTLNDLISLCPTCHRIAHMREPIYKPSEIRQIRAG